MELLLNDILRNVMVLFFQYVNCVHILYIRTNIYRVFFILIRYQSTGSLAAWYNYLIRPESPERLLQIWPLAVLISVLIESEQALFAAVPECVALRRVHFDGFCWLSCVRFENSFWIMGLELSERGFLRWFWGVPKAAGANRPLSNVADR